MTTEKTKLRRDLVVSRQETSGAISFIFKDPATGRFFRFGEVEQYIAQQLDGITELESIRRGTEQKFGIFLSAHTFMQFLHSLRNCGLLEPELTESEPQPRNAVRQKRVLGKFLYLRLKAFDPDRLFARLLGYVSCCFTPVFVAVSAVAILSALMIVIANWSEVHQGVLRLYRFDALFLVWLTLILITTAHEFAHGLTCKHFGGEVHDLGFLLIYFQPAFYCNVSETWLLPKKSQRLWVMFAGAYFELFIWAVAALSWRLTEPGTNPNRLALIVTATCGVRSLFNLNPLIKLDGYYLLSDYLEVPNLRSRSFSYLRAAVKRWLSVSESRAISRVGVRERRIYVIYGLLAGTYSYWLLSLIILNVGKFLTVRYEGFGFVLFTGLVMIALHTPLSKVIPRRTGSAGHSLTGMRHRRIITAVALAIAMAVLFTYRTELKVSSEFKVLPVRNAEVRAEIEGIIDEIYVEEGDAIEQGASIAHLSDRDLRAELQMTEAAIDEKRAKLKMLQAGARPEEIDLARKAVDTAKTRSEFALRRYDEASRIRVEGIARASATVARAKDRVRYAANYLGNARILFEEKLIPRLQMDKAEEDAALTGKELDQANAEMNMASADDLAEVRRARAVADKELEEAQGRLRILLAGSRPEEIEATRAEMSNQQAHLHHLQQSIGLVKILSPISGVITTPKLKERKGQFVSKGDLIAAVHEMTKVNVEIRVSEKEIADIKPGQKVVLKARAYPLNSFKGQVTSISPIASQLEQPAGSSAVLVSCRIDNPALLLKPEMTGRAKIYCGKQRASQVLMRRISRYLRIELGVATLERRPSRRGIGGAGPDRCGIASSDQNLPKDRWLGVVRWPPPFARSSACRSVPCGL